MGARKEMEEWTCEQGSERLKQVFPKITKKRGRNTPGGNDDHKHCECCPVARMVESEKPWQSGSIDTWKVFAKIQKVFAIRQLFAQNSLVGKETIRMVRKHSG